MIVPTKLKTVQRPVLNVRQILLRLIHPSVLSAKIQLDSLIMLLNQLLQDVYCARLDTLLIMVTLTLNRQLIKMVFALV